MYRACNNWCKLMFFTLLKCYWPKHQWQQHHRHLIYIDWSMALTADVVVNVSYVSGRQKNTLWKAGASSRHKTKQAVQQDRQADKTGRLTRQSGLPNLFQAGWLLFVPITFAHVSLKWMFHKLICVEQYTPLRYLWATVTLVCLGSLGQWQMFLLCCSAWGAKPCTAPINNIGIFMPKANITF